MDIGPYHTPIAYNGNFAMDLRRKQAFTLYKLLAEEFGSRGSNVNDTYNAFVP